MFYCFAGIGIGHQVQYDVLNIVQSDHTAGSGSTGPGVSHRDVLDDDDLEANANVDSGDEDWEDRCNRDLDDDVNQDDANEDEDEENNNENEDELKDGDSDVDYGSSNSEDEGPAFIF
jgi:hypothetical protein